MTVLRSARAALIVALAWAGSADAAYVVLRDGRRYEVERYRIDLDTEVVVLLSGEQQATVPLAGVDFEATFRANAESGADPGPLKTIRDPEQPFEFRIFSWKADPTAGDFGSVAVHGEVVNLDARAYREVQIELITVDSRHRAIDKSTTVVSDLEPQASAEFQVELRYFGGEADVLAHVIKTKR